MRRVRLALLAAASLWLAGCDLLGIESASDLAERREAEGKAIGGACRHAARSIEACYELNRRADKAAMFAGWREMNDYMRENQLEAMPALEPARAAAATAADDGAPAAEGLAGQVPVAASKTVSAGRRDDPGAGAADRAGAAKAPPPRVLRNPPP
jgi:hypothetical protein